MISWTWHYDLDGLKPSPDLMPALNLYTGLGDSITIGTGIQLSGLTYLSVAKYFPQDNGDNRVLFFHLNQPLGRAYDNPYFEVGGGVISDFGRGTNGMLLGGVALGTGIAYPIIPGCSRDADEHKKMRDFVHKWRLMPFVKTAVLGRELGFSTSYYAGKSSAATKNVINAVLKYNDTLVVVPHDEVDSIAGPSELNDVSYGAIVIFLKRDSVIYLGHQYWEYMDPNLVTTWRPLISSLPPGYDYFYVDGMPAVLNIHSIYETWKSGGDIVLTKYPPDAAQWLESRIPWSSDVSFGVGLIAYPDWLRPSQ